MLMSRLRSVLGRDRIEHRDRGYLLRCDWLDAAELAVLTDEVDAAGGRATWLARSRRPGWRCRWSAARARSRCPASGRGCGRRSWSG